MVSAKICTGIFACLILAACGGGSTAPSTSNGGLVSRPPVPDSNLPSGGQIPASIPNDGIQPWEESGSRGQSALDPGSEYIAGRDWFSTSATGTSSNGEALRLSAGANGVTWAIYRLPHQGTQPGTLIADINLLRQPAGSASHYNIAVANYGTGRWDWHGPLSEAHLRLPLSIDIGNGADYLSPFGNTFVCVLVDYENNVDVIGLGSRAVNLADSVPPRMVEGVSAAAVAGGIDISWKPAESADLAGYMLSYSPQYFFSPDSPGVHTEEFLVPGNRYILKDTDGGKHIAIRAIDHSGNIGPAARIFARTLEGIAGSLVLSASPSSVKPGQPSELTAAGMPNLGIDQDGMNQLDYSPADSAGQWIDTSLHGVRRISALGEDPASGQVAMAGVSVIVNGNTRPLAIATATPTTGQAPLVVEFRGQSEDLEDSADQLFYSWDFDGDGIYEPFTDTLEPPAHTYATPGIYNARFLVRDSDGGTDVDTVAVFVDGYDGHYELPAARLSMEPGITQQGSTVTADASASTAINAAITRYEWDLDGNGSWDGYTDYPVLEFNAEQAGVIELRLRVTDEFGRQDVTSATLRVNERLISVHPWPCLAHDARHTGRSENQGSPLDNLLWSYDAGAPLHSAPVVDSLENCYFGDMDGNLHALDETGSLLWKFDAGAAITNSPALLGDGKVIFATDEGTVHCLDSTGNEMWKFQSFSGNCSAPLVSEDQTIYIVLGVRLYALNPDGSLRWIGEEQATSNYLDPVLMPDGAIVSDGGGRVAALVPAGKTAGQRSKRTVPIRRNRHRTGQDDLLRLMDEPAADLVFSCQPIPGY